MLSANVRIITGFMSSMI